MNDYVIRLLDHFECMSFMAFLSTY